MAVFDMVAINNGTPSPWVQGFQPSPSQVSQVIATKVDAESGQADNLLLNGGTLTGTIVANGVTLAGTFSLQNILANSVNAGTLIANHGTVMLDVGTIAALTGGTVAAGTLTANHGTVTLDVGTVTTATLGSLFIGGDTIAPGFVPGGYLAVIDDGTYVAVGLLPDGSVNFGKVLANVAVIASETVTGNSSIAGTATIGTMATGNALITGGTVSAAIDSPGTFIMGAETATAAFVPGGYLFTIDDGTYVALGVTPAGVVVAGSIQGTSAYFNNLSMGTITLPGSLALGTVTVTDLFALGGTVTPDVLIIGSETSTAGFVPSGFLDVIDDGTYVVVGLRVDGTFVIGNAEIHNAASLNATLLTATTLIATGATLSALDMGGAKITTVGTPVSAGDVANRGWVLSVVGGSSGLGVGTIDLAASGLIGDLQTYSMNASFTNGGTVVVLGSTGSGTLTATTAVQSNAIALTGTQPLTSADIGLPFSMTSTHGVWNTGTVEAVENSGTNQTVYVSSVGAPWTTTSESGVTWTKGLRLTSSNNGNAIRFGANLPGAGYYTGTISAVSNHNTVTVGSTIAATAFGLLSELAIGTDNYSAFKTLLNANVGTTVIQANSGFYCSQLPVEATRSHWRGDGTIYYPGGTDSSPISFLDKVVVPWRAPSPPPPLRGVPASVALALLHGKTTVNVATIGASTTTPDPGSAGMQSSPTYYILERLQVANPGVKFVFRNFSVGGGNIPAYTGAASVPAPVDWWDGSSPWIGNNDNHGEVFNFTPDLVIIELSSNDVPSKVTISEMTGLFAMFKLANAFPTQPAVILVPNPYQNQSGSNIIEDFFDGTCRVYETIARAYGYGVINIRHLLTMYRTGVDVMQDVMTRVPVPTTGAIGNIHATGYTTRGFHAGFTYSDTPANFWAAAGNLMGSTSMNTNEGSFQYAPTVKFGYDPDGAFPGGAADTLFVQSDLGFDLPGAGIPGGSVPSIRGSFSITSGSNALTYAPVNSGPTNLFDNARDNGKIVVVPGAGSTSSALSTSQYVRAAMGNAWLGTLAGPLVAYAKYISGTQIQLFSDAGLSTPLNAVTTLSSNVQQILWGCPRVYLPITGISTDSSSSTFFEIWAHGSQFGVHWMSQDSKTFATPAVRLYMRFPLIHMFNGPTDIGIGGKLHYTAEAGFASLYKFKVASPRLSAPQMTDDEIEGTGFGRAEPNPSSGTGANHPSDGAVRLYQAALNAVDLHIP